MKVYEVHVALGHISPSTGQSPQICSLPCSAQLPISRFSSASSAPTAKLNNKSFFPLGRAVVLCLREGGRRRKTDLSPSPPPYPFLLDHRKKKKHRGFCRNSVESFRHLLGKKALNFDQKQLTCQLLQITVVIIELFTVKWTLGRDRESNGVSALKHQTTEIRHFLRAAWWLMCWNLNSFLIKKAIDYLFHPNKWIWFC